MQASDITAHEYDQIRAMPTSLGHYHESVFSKSYHVLYVVKALLKAGVPNENILSIIRYLETPLPGNQKELEEQVAEAYAFDEIDTLLKEAHAQQTLLGFPIIYASKEEFDHHLWERITDATQPKTANQEGSVGCTITLDGVEISGSTDKQDTPS
jgi:hypothetical protein